MKSLYFSNNHPVGGLLRQQGQAVRDAGGALPRPGTRTLLPPLGALRSRGQARYFFFRGPFPLFHLIRFRSGSSSIIHCITVLSYVCICIVSHFTNYTFYTFNYKTKKSFKLKYKNFKNFKIPLCFYIILDFLFLSMYHYLPYPSIYLYSLSIYLLLYNLSIYQSNYLSIKPVSSLFIFYIILCSLPLLWTIRPCFIL